MKKENIVIVEPISTGVNYIHDVRELGHNPICLELYQEEEKRKELRKIRDESYSLNDEELPQIIEADKSYEKTLEMVKDTNPLAIIPASDAGIIWATKMAHDLGLLGNDPKNLKKMIDKQSMQDALKEANIRYIKSQFISSYDEAKEFVSKLSLLGHKYTKVNDEYFDELEDLLIMADIGVKTVMDFIDKLRDRVKQENITDTEYLQEVIVDELFIIYVNGESLSDKINMQDNGPTVILMVGVNGVGKTTTIAKLAYKYKNMGKKVAMIAADTFRAGAVKQLEEWAERTGSIFYGKEETDPAGVIYDGLDKAVKEKADIVLIDTAGRLQNKVNLMNELEKINRVIGKFIPDAPHETLLVIDATTGQNGILQAKAFKEITNITGIVLTKLDGTAKGGIVLAIKEEVNLPVKFVGLGEKMEDLQTFDIENYIYGLFKDMVE